MKRDQRASTSSAELRRRAEALLKEKKGTAEYGQPGETQRLIHELQVHQIELALQNEELERTRGVVEEELQRYSELYDFAPVGYPRSARRARSGG